MGSPSLNMQRPRFCIQEVTRRFISVLGHWPHGSFRPWTIKTRSLTRHFIFFKFILPFSFFLFFCMEMHRIWPIYFFFYFASWFPSFIFFKLFIHSHFNFLWGTSTSKCLLPTKKRVHLIKKVSDSYQKWWKRCIKTKSYSAPHWK